MIANLQYPFKPTVNNFATWKITAWQLNLNWYKNFNVSHEEMRFLKADVGLFKILTSQMDLLCTGKYGKSFFLSIYFLKTLNTALYET